MDQENETENLVLSVYSLILKKSDTAEKRIDKLEDIAVENIQIVT